MKPLDAVVLTDTHYYSKKNWIDGDPDAFPPPREQLFRRGSEEIVRHVFDALCADGTPQTVLISGDLTNNGEVTSHEEFRALLRRLRARGKRIYVTTATHDFRGEGLSYGFDRHGRRVDVPAFVREDLRGFYREFGPDEAVGVHEPSMSYAVELTDEYRLLALNDDKGCDHAGFTNETFDWICAQIADAHRKGQFVLAMTHHPVLSPSPLYRLIAPGDLLEDGENRAKQFADLGVPCIFTGHSHIHNITSIRSAKGCVCYDVSTSALVGFPPNYRIVRFDPDCGSIDVRTETVDAVLQLDTGGLPLSAFLERQFLGVVTDILDAAERDYTEFTRLAQGLSIRPEQARRLKPVLRPAAKALNHLTFGTVWHWTRRRSGVTRAQIAPLLQTRVVPFVVSLAANLYRGDAALDKGSVEYRTAEAFLQLADSLAKPFADKLRAAGVESLSAACLPLLHNDGLPDNNCTLRF